MLAGGEPSSSYQKSKRRAGGVANLSCVRLCPSLQLTFGNGSMGLPSRKFLRDFSMSGVGGCSSAVQNKVPVEVVSLRTHAEALVGLGQSPASTIA